MKTFICIFTAQTKRGALIRRTFKRIKARDTYEAGDIVKTRYGVGYDDLVNRVLRFNQPSLKISAAGKAAVDGASDEE